MLLLSFLKLFLCSLFFVIDTEKFVAASWHFLKEKMQLFLLQFYGNFWRHVSCFEDASNVIIVEGGESDASAFNNYLFALKVPVSILPVLIQSSVSFPTFSRH